jgi:archaellum component FlaC
MNTQKSVYNKLFKEETQLASHEVELSIKDDVDTALNQIYDAYDKTDKGITKFYNELFAAKKTYETAKSEISNLLNKEKALEDLKVKMLNMGKELGIDVTGAPFYKELLAALKRMDAIKLEIKASEQTYKGINI